MTLLVAHDKKIARQVRLGGLRVKLATIDIGDKQTDHLIPETKQLSVEIVTDAVTRICSI